MQVLFTYVLVSESTGNTYVGQTENLRRRIEEHNDPNNRQLCTPKDGLGRDSGSWESHGSRAAAMKRERFLKTGHGREWIKARLAAWLANPSLP